jgi:hypothetical protein
MVQVLSLEFLFEEFLGTLQLALNVSVQLELLLQSRAGIAVQLAGQLSDL